MRPIVYRRRFYDPLAHLYAVRLRSQSTDRRGCLSPSSPRRRFSTDVVHSTRPPPRVAIIGSGPAGFYAARKLLSLVDDAIIDMYEQLPVPFGLVRYGVAPDHPEVKNCEETFAEVAKSPRFNFIGNIQIGSQLPVENLLPHYDALLFAYGASKDRELGLEGEKDCNHIYSARAFVGWYNGLPEYRDLDPDLTAGEDAVIIGQGNVALDVARILLTDIDVLSKTDITEYALEKLSKSRIKNIHIVGRRGPVQAAFTIKEIREMLQLPNTSFKPMLESLFPANLKALPRPQRRILELLKNASSVAASNKTSKSWSLDFLLSPQSLHYSTTDSNQLDHITFTRNQLTDPTSPKSSLVLDQPSTTTSTVSMPAQTVFRSIGYKSEALQPSSSSSSSSSSSAISLPFDTSKGTFPHDGSGRILLPTNPQRRHPSSLEEKPEIITRLYCAGWVRRGPTGVIASTMTDAFITAEAMATDLADTTTAAAGGGTICTNHGKKGWPAVQEQAQRQGIKLGRRVSWHDWLIIDRVERMRGTRIGEKDKDKYKEKKKKKPREKLTRVKDMLAVLDEETKEK